jgi:hypothetical protein
MLDELDALMERMLSLPVDGVDTSALPPPPSFPGMEATAIAEPAALNEPAALEGQAALEVLEPPAPPPTSPQPTAQLPAAAPALVPEPPSPLQGPHMWPVPAGKIIVGRLSAPPVYSPPSLEETTQKKSQVIEPAGELAVGVATGSSSEVAFPPLLVKPAVKVPVRRRSILRAGLRLLLWFNQSFDQATTRLGATGRSLRSVRGRRLLGLAGLALLGLAIAWCLHDWLGWTWFKVSLE